MLRQSAIERLRLAVEAWPIFFARCAGGLNGAQESCERSVGFAVCHLDAEGLVTVPDPERDHPLLLAMSDNGGPMVSHATREFFAALAIAQRLGRPGTPADD